MTQFSQKISADIYKIDTNKFTGPTSDIIDKIIAAHNNKTSNVQYVLEELDLRILNNTALDLRLYVNVVQEYAPDWIGFVEEIALHKDSATIKRLKRKYPSFLLFVSNSESIYAIAKGAAHFVILNYIYDDFGIDVQERLIKPTETDIRKTKERGVVGSIAASEKYYNQDHKIGDEDLFGKQLNGVEALIVQNDLRMKLGIQTSRNSLIVNGENSLKISNSVTIDGLLNRIQLIHQLLQTPKTIELNKFIKLKTNELRRIINEVKLKDCLNSALVEDSYKQFQSGEIIEVFHPKIMDFLKCSGIKLIYNRNPYPLENDHRFTLQSLFEELQISIYSLEGYRDGLESVSTELVFENGEEMYKVNLFDWISGEIDFNGNKYFKFDGEWYKYRSEFIKEINERVTNLLDSNIEDRTLPTWNRGQSEGLYNLSCKQLGFTVCDQGVYKGIEICDLFRLENGTLKLYHVKNGWGQSIRVVYNQIINGAKFLRELQFNNDKKLFKEYYNSVIAHNYKNEQLSLKEFEQCLKTRKVEFVLVYGSTKTKNLNDEIISSRSNIAKLSIIQQSELRSTYGFSFSITKLHRP